MHWNMATFTGGDDAAAETPVDTFNPTGLDIDNWLDAFESAGMRYAFLTTKAAAGFCLWPSTYHVEGYDPYSIGQTTWYANTNRDVVMEFVTKCRQHGINPGLYYAVHADSTWNSRTGATPTTNRTAYQAMISAQLTELLSNYGDLCALWIDGWSYGVGYLNLPYELVRGLINTYQPNTCLLVDNSHIHPPYYGDIEVYETDVAADKSIPAGNTRLSEEVDTCRSDNRWYYDEAMSQTSTAFLSASAINALKNNANNNYGTFLLGITPDKVGVLPAALVTRLGEVGA